MSFVPHRFLVRVCHPCRMVTKIPIKGGDELLDLPASCRIDNYAGMDDKKNFADVRLAWNDGGLAIQVSVAGKSEPLHCDPTKPRFSDGLSIWIDTRGDRTSHRASRTCHLFHVLPVGGGDDGDAPIALQAKINRAQQDAPLCEPGDLPTRTAMITRGYRIETFLPATVLNGFAPADHPVLGFYYVVRDQELGEQALSVGSEFPYADDPSLWSALELIKS